GAGIGALAELRGPVYRAGAVAVLLVMLGVQMRAAHASALKPRSASREAARVVAQNAKPGDLVITVPDSVAPSFNSYLPRGLVQLAVPEMTRVDWIDWQGWAQRLDDEQLAANFEAELRKHADEGRRVWLVLWPPVKGGLPRGLSRAELYQ